MALIALSTMSYTTAALPSFSAASASDTFQGPSAEGRRFAVYRNTAAASRTITVDLVSIDTFGRTNTDLVYTLATSTGELWIPLHPSMSDSTGAITITCSSTTSVTVAHVAIA